MVFKYSSLVTPKPLPPPAKLPQSSQIIPHGVQSLYYAFSLLN